MNKAALLEHVKEIGPEGSHLSENLIILVLRYFTAGCCECARCGIIRCDRSAQVERLDVTGLTKGAVKSETTLKPRFAGVLSAGRFD
jgi:hypothetical protein